MYVTHGRTTFNVVDLQRWSRTAVYTKDRATLLYVRHVLGFVLTYAPGGLPSLVSATGLSPDTVGRLGGALVPLDGTFGALTADPRGRDPGVVAAVVDPPDLEPRGGPAPLALHRSAPETDAELRDRMMRPRQKFILWARDRQTGAAVRWLESPRPGFSRDATTGPIPLCCDMVGASGQPTSAAFYWEVQTDLPACPQGSDRFVLSHRWEMRHLCDDDNYLTREIEGEVVFNGGVGDIIRTSPDTLRKQFIHPIPVGFQRKIPLVKLSSDGLVLHYVVHDTDPTIVFSAGDSGCTNILISERSTINIPEFGG